MKNTWVIIIFWVMFQIGFSLHAQVQNLEIFGTVTDTLEEPLPGATVMVISMPDSNRVTFSTTNNHGIFTISNIAPDTLLLQIDFLGFQRKFIPFIHEGKKRKISFGNIRMQPKISNLQVVEINAPHLPMQIKEDTIEFNPTAYSVEHNAVVEELLKKLPGVEVDENGNIKINGEPISTILVDGEDFFANDPKSASKNLPADIIAKIQVFDKKSDQAKFSGVNDGKEVKAINLKLKPDRKKGYFGMASGGYGSQDRYSGNLNFNRFNKKQRASLYGRFNNTAQNRQGEFSQYGSTFGDGFTTAGSISANYRNSLSKTFKINGSYRYSNSNNERDNQSLIRNILTAEPFNEDQSSRSRSSHSSHRMDIHIEKEIDTTQSLRLKLRGSLRDRNNVLNSNVDIYNLDDKLLSSSIRNNQSGSKNSSWSGDLLFRKRFNKKKSNFYISTEWNMADTESNQSITSLYDYLQGNPGPSVPDSIWQYQLNGDDQFRSSISSSFTEPLSENNYLSLSYYNQYSHNDNYRNVHELLSVEEVLLGEMIPELSNTYDRTYHTNRGKLSFRKNKDKNSLSLGLTLQSAKLQGKTASDGSLIKSSFLNILPEASLRFIPSKGKSLRFNYSTSIRPPTLTQLQPYRNNSNPLKIFIGNPNLKPSYSHRIRMNYNTFNQESLTNLFFNLNASFSDNPIITSKTIDTLFRQTSTPINVDHAFSTYGNFSFGKTLAKIKMRVNAGLNLRWSNSYVHVNNHPNAKTSFGKGISSSIKNTGKKDLEYRIFYNYNNTQTLYDVDKALERNYNTQSFGGSLKVKFLEKWRLNTSLNYSIYGGDAFNEKQIIPKWNTSLSTFLFDRDQLQLMISAFDLLNRNQGLSRINSLNTFVESQTTTLSRYIIISAVFSIKKFGI